MSAITLSEIQKNKIMSFLRTCSGGQWELLPHKYSRIAGHFFTKLTTSDQVTHSPGQNEGVESPRRCCPAPLHFSG